MRSRGKEVVLSKKKVVKARNRRTKDISDNIYVSGADGNTLTDYDNIIKNRWQ